MKRFAFLLFLWFAGYPFYAQNADSTSLPGDNLNLYAVLDLFKNSGSVEQFERKLNDTSSHINNLDLDNDNKIDYIRVVDYGKDNYHSIVLQDLLGPNESQDVAVIEIEKQNGDIAHVQIVGDEDLYGKNYVIEPQLDNAPQGHAQQPVQSQQPNTVVYDTPPPAPAATFVNVWAWPSVQFVYAPAYVYYVSPWYWGYYPGWWRPWRPMGFYAYHRGFYGYRAYRPYYRRTYVNNIVVAHNIYYGHRAASVVVQRNIGSNVYAHRNFNGHVNRVNGAGPPRVVPTGGGRKAVSNKIPVQAPRGNWGGMEKHTTAQPGTVNQRPAAERGAAPQREMNAAPRREERAVSQPRMNEGTRMGSGGNRGGGGRRR